MSRFIERIRLLRQEEAERLNRWIDAERHSEWEANEKEKRDAKLSTDALNNSIVRQYAFELSELLLGKSPNRPLEGFGTVGHISIVVVEDTERNGWYRGILIDGHPDGTVTINGKRLNQQDKYNPDKVGSVLEHAYKHPGKIVRNGGPIFTEY